jgi:D-xylose transport system permease protein
MSSTHPGGGPGPDNPGSVAATQVAAVEAEHEQAALAGAPELVADSIGDYAGIWLKRIRSGESGALPIIVGLIIIVIFFQIKNSNFLSAGNLVNLLVQGSPYVLLGMAEVWVLLLGEIDLSVGYNAAIGAVVTLWAVYSLPWWVAIIMGLAASGIIGLVQGGLITWLRLPSFVVTLAGLLGLEGLLQILINSSGHGTGGTIPNPNNVLNDLASGSLSPVASWIVMIVIVAGAGVFMITRDQRRRASGLVAPPLGVTTLKVAFMAIAGIVVVLVGNTNRGVLIAQKGVPWIVFIVIGVLVLYTILTGRTKFGRYIYAIGGNAEAARRAGIGLGRIRTLAFALTGVTAGLGGIAYMSRLSSISSNVDGGQLVLFAVAAAVIGGTNLFGGRGRMMHALLGGLVVATIYNGLSLIGLSAAATDIITAIVLLVAVTVDTLARRNSTAAR